MKTSNKFGHFIEQPHPTPPKLLNYKTLHQFYGLHKSTVAKMVMLGTFTDVVKIGNKNYFKREDVEEWIDNNTIEVL